VDARRHGAPERLPQGKCKGARRALRSAAEGAERVPCRQEAPCLNEHGPQRWPGACPERRGSTAQACHRERRRFARAVPSRPARAARKETARTAGRASYATNTGGAAVAHACAGSGADGAGHRWSAGAPPPCVTVPVATTPSRNGAGYVREALRGDSLQRARRSVIQRF